MTLYDYLEGHRAEIFERIRGLIAKTSPRGSDAELIESLPELYDDVIAALREDVGLPRQTSNTTDAKSATSHGRQRLRLGFTITQLVHDYGAMCNSITEYAKQRISISAREYQIFNHVLDVAIAAAVEEYSSVRQAEHSRLADSRANEHLGFVAHELRNAISAAMLSFDAIRKGTVGASGRTSAILERSLTRLQTLVDRSLTEVRLKSGLPLAPEPTRLRELLDETETACALDAESKGSHLEIQADRELEATVDRQLMLSVLVNLVQNALKYSPPGSQIVMRCTAVKDDMRIEVEDQCGGLDESTMNEMFAPFVRGHHDAKGLGLGLAIARQAAEVHGGRLEVRSVNRRGCVFAVQFPKTPGATI